MKNKLLEKFQEKFGSNENTKIYFAPGRVNLIGEHIDYNGGHVFPCALTIGTYGVVRKRIDRKLCFYSMNFDEYGMIEGSLNDLEPKHNGNWTEYLKGIIWSFGKKNKKIDCGMDLLLFGNIPNGSGLSSSASVEILMGYILVKLFDISFNNMELALIGQFSENYYNGVNCGIMDQFACAMGKKDYAIFLDTADLSYKYIPIELKNAKIVIACSNKKRELGDSKYNERREQCEKALVDLQKVIDIKTLGDLTKEQFEAYQNNIKDSINLKRARHAVEENQRTLKATQALKCNDIVKFGMLMNESHISLRDNYEVTGIELDTLVEEAWNTKGVLGSRMTGAGFGGCTVNIVLDNAISSFIKNVGEVYLNKIGYEADFYVVDIGDGPKEI